MYEKKRTEVFCMEGLLKVVPFFGILALNFCGLSGSKGVKAGRRNSAHEGNRIGHQ